MGKAVLASQFLTGLHRDIKSKFAGCDNDLEQLFVKARFEEAKIRDLGSAGGFWLWEANPRDHECGGTDHYIRQCPYR